MNLGTLKKKLYETEDPIKLKEIQAEYDDIRGLILKCDPYFQETKFNYFGYEYCANPVCKITPDDYDCPFRCETTKEKKTDISGMYPIRNAVVSRPGWVILGVDYSQIELRIAANLSGESAWIEAFLNGIDVHDSTAKAVFKHLSQAEYDRGKKQFRKLAKTCNFGALYGGGPGVLATNAGISIEEAKEIYMAWCNGVPTVMRWLKAVQANALKEGYTSTFFGRRRYLSFPEVAKRFNNKESMSDKDKMYLSADRRRAGNHAVQGLAADFMKIALVKVYKALQKSDLKDDVLMLSTIHDEILYEVRQSKLLEAVRLIQPLMEVHNFENWKVPLICDVEASWSWGSVENYEEFLLDDAKKAVIREMPEHKVKPATVLINKGLTETEAEKLTLLIGQFPGDEPFQILYKGSKINFSVGNKEALIDILRDENIIV